MVVGVVGILAAIVLSGISSAKERSRRIRCLNNLKQFITACHMYAGDHDDELPSGLDNNNREPIYSARTGINSHTINLSDATMEALREYSGDTNVAYCPGFTHGWISSYYAKYGYTIGYNYLAGHKFSTSNYSEYASWRSPQQLNEDSSLPLIADANHWATQDKWTIVPHGSRGPITQSGSYFIRGEGLPSETIGAAGGNVGYLDGSVGWKQIGKMKAHIASTHDDKYVGAW